MESPLYTFLQEYLINSLARYFLLLEFSRHSNDFVNNETFSHNKLKQSNSEVMSNQGHIMFEASITRNFCCGCLSSDRLLRKLGEFLELFNKINKNVDDVSTLFINQQFKKFNELKKELYFVFNFTKTSIQLPVLVTTILCTLLLLYHYYI